MDAGPAVARPAWVDIGPPSLARGAPRMGPQAERTSEWVNRTGEVQAPTQREVCMRMPMGFALFNV